MLKNINEYTALEELLEWTGSIDNIYNPKIFGLDNIPFLELIYSQSKEVNPLDITIAKSLDHTMYDAIDEYVKQKLPVDLFREAILKKKKIEIHGIYSEHFKKQGNLVENQYLLQVVNFKHNPNHKPLNFVRPAFYVDKERLCVLVTPGKDYLLHYASLILYLLDTLTTRWSNLVKILRYPYAENSIHVWSGLSQDLVQKGDILILGYVNELQDYIRLQDENTVFDKHENQYYTSARCKINDKNICLLGVKFSFWGNLSAKIINRILNLGAAEIIYFGKLGTLKHPDDIYTKLYSPTVYSVVYHDKLVCLIDDLPNHLTIQFPELNTHMHTSVPTILEEDYIQRGLLDTLKTNSIDNEISQIAYTIKKYNEDFNSQVKYSCIHFPTDYIRQLDKPDILTDHDLSTNRTVEALEKKKIIIQKACDYLYKYLTK